MRYAIIIVFTALFLGCVEPPLQGYEPTENVSPAFSKYWFDGNAEVATYELKQSRYGQLRSGEAILITVTEPFNGKMQVKSDGGNSASYNVLKTNLLKRFTTGIYDYSSMTSTFVPLNNTKRQPAAKVSNSVQDWCGQAYGQLNRVEGEYHFRLQSYFESEVLESVRIQPQLLLDEVFALVRMSPELLPQGEVMFTRSAELSRYMHRSMDAVKGMAQLDLGKEKGTYTIETGKERYSWEFTSVFPHTIVGWKEQRLDGDGNAVPNLATEATLKKQMRTPYWAQNANNFSNLRDTLRIGQ